MPPSKEEGGYYLTNVGLSIRPSFCQLTKWFRINILKTSYYRAFIFHLLIGLCNNITCINFWFTRSTVKVTRVFFVNNGFRSFSQELPIYWTKQWMHHLIDQCIYQTHHMVTYYKWRIYHTKYFFTFSKKMFYIYFIDCYLKWLVPRTGVQNKNIPGETLICVHFDLPLWNDNSVSLNKQAFSVKRYPPPMMACLWLMACLCMKVFMFMCNWPKKKVWIF